MTTNIEKQTKEQKIATAIEKLLGYDSIKHYRNNLTDMFFAYNQSELSDCHHDRGHKTSTYIYLGEFLTALTEYSRK